jgi:putative salt-induced outer membrane protein
MRIVAAISMGVSLAAGISAPASAADGWGGEGSANAGFASGNSETADVGISLKLNYRDERWRNGIEFQYDYAEQNGEESKNRFFVSYQLDRDFSRTLFGYLRSSYEQNQFSGFDSRAFLGPGVGAQLVESGVTNWRVKGGPGFKRDEVKTKPAKGTEPAVPAAVENSVAFFAGSSFKHDLTPALALTQTTDVTYAEVSTQVVGVVSLNARFTEKLSGRMSVTSRYESQPPVGKDDTDTATRFGLSYEFG